ncbi:MAG: sugar ABC transporter permease [Afipia sp. 62-7]|nr:ABC transporter permease [Afipia sp.]OJU21490.1 MAG: sugar ABC transporter permease [Afipia sp. 62-7]
MLNLSGQLIHREVSARYRGSALGTLWALLTPLFMLAIYTFLFGTVLQVRWGAQQNSTADFAIILFSGLIVFHFFSEVVTRAPTLILSNVNFVKKVVFPIEILPVVALGTALFHMALSLLVLLAFFVVLHGTIQTTVLLLPFAIAPLALLLLGLSWFLAALGVYMRDINQIIGPVMTALMFVSPIFVPATSLPERVRAFVFLNPVAIPVEALREVVIFGHAPNWIALAIYTVVATLIAILGYLFFQKTRKGFADVL